jgi:hypothetical protein
MSSAYCPSFTCFDASISRRTGRVIVFAKKYTINIAKFSTSIVISIFRR